MKTQRKNFFWSSVAALVLNFASPANAGIFDEADRLFALRSQGTAAVAAARNAYLSAMTGQTGDNLVYAIQQIGRLANYEGNYLLGTTSQNHSRKAEIFGQCRQLSSRIDNQPEYISQYSYWRIACTAQYMQYASLGQRLSILGEVKQDFNELVDDNLEIRAELNVDTRYEQGGVERTLAAIYSNSLSNMIRDGLPNETKSLAMAERSIRAAPYPGSTVSGGDFYRNQRQRAEALYELGRDREADVYIQQTIDEIDERIADGELPVGLEPETLGEKSILASMLNL